MRLVEFAPDSNDSGGEDDALHKYARMWWAGDEATQMQIERALARMGWEIGEDEGGYDNGGVFVVRAGDINGDSYTSWPAEDLAEAKKKRKKKSSRSLRGYFFPGYAYYGAGDSGEGSGDGGGESKNPGQARNELDEKNMGQPRVAAAKPEILSAADDGKTITVRVRAPDGTTRSIANSNPAVVQQWLNVKYGLRLPASIARKFVGMPASMAEGEVTKTTTGLRHRATDKYGASNDEPHHYTGGRSGFSDPGQYARDLEHVNKQLVKDLDASMGISWKNRGTKGVEVDEQGVAEGSLNEKSTSQAQFRTMAAAAHDPKFAKKVGIKQSVAREFNQADKGQSYKSLPKKT